MMLHHRLLASPESLAGRETDGSRRHPWRQTPTRRLVRVGFSLVELLLALLFLSSVMLGMLWMTSSSTRGSMDAYYELLATQLALEPIEVFRSFGYRWLTTYAEHPLPSYPLETWAEIKDPLFGGFRHPPECQVFQRRITLTPVPGKPEAIQISVRVAPKSGSRARAWLLKSDISMESLVFERPE